ncbi:MAG: hypothetical protein KJO09_05720 [Gammaproteobacteria bacterium]|nr:hypothetical protein [Gammaproteobacteria bacterium]
MNGEKDNLDEEVIDETTDDSLTATVVITEDDDDIVTGDSTVEMDIEKLVAKLDASDKEDVHRRAEIRHKLEELREQREQELDSTFNFKFDDED